MPKSLLFLLAIVLAVAGFAGLAFSQKQHRPLLGNAPPSAAGLRASGWGLLALAIVPAVARDGVAFGVLLWVAILTPSALGVTVWITARGRERSE